MTGTVITLIVVGVVVLLFIFFMVNIYNRLVALKKEPLQEWIRTDRSPAQAAL